MSRQPADLLSCSRALVLSPITYNRSTGLALVVPVTSHVKGYPFEVLIPTGLPITGAILADHLKSLDWQARNAARICTLSRDTLRHVLQKAALLLSNS